VLAAADADRLPGGPTDDHPARHGRGHPDGLSGRGQPPARRVGPARRPERRSRGPGGAGHVGRTRGARPAGDSAAGPGGRRIRYLARLSGVRLTVESGPGPTGRPPAGRQSPARGRLRPPARQQLAAVCISVIGGRSV
jgi:hypothetical protein